MTNRSGGVVTGPIALLTALIVIETFTTGHRLAIDARAAGLAAA